MNKKIYLSESELRELIGRVIQEQSMGGMASPQTYAQYTQQGVSNVVDISQIKNLAIIFPNMTKWWERIADCLCSQNHAVYQQQNAPV